MSVRALAGLAILGAGLAACSPAAPIVHPTSTATASAAPMARLPDAKAAVEPSVEPEPALPLPPSPGPDALAKLPPGAVIYVAVRPTDLPGSAAMLVLHLWIPFELTRPFHRDKTPDAFLTSIGIDARRTILVALVPPSEKSARAVIDSVVVGAADDLQEKLVRDHAGDAQRVRILVPLVKGTDPAAAAATLGGHLSGSGAVESCPGAAACAGFGADAPLVIATGKKGIVAAYADGADLRLDLVAPLFGPPTDPGALASLIAFRALRGGSGARCQSLDPGASVAVCLDLDAAGQLGVSMGYWETFRTLPQGLLVRGPRRTSAAAGRARALQNLALAAPDRRLASDGTLMIRAQGMKWSALATWALTPASRSGVEKAFATRRCAPGPAAVTELLPVLQSAFGAPGKGFSDPHETQRALVDAGLGAYLITLAGAWPNLLDLASTALPRDLAPGASQQACLHHDAGRLVLEINDAP
jgi:hypothetical protein